MYIIYIYKENEQIMSISLLHKVDFDPINRRKNPYLLDYIFTFSKFRGKGIATFLLRIIRQKHNITSLCSNDESYRCHIKAGYKLHDISDDLFIMTS